MKIARPRAAVIALAVSALASAGIGVAIAGGPGLGNEPVPQAQSKTLGISSPNVLARPWVDVELVRGSQPLENPDANATHYGYYTSDLPMVPLPPSTAEKTKTEPDKNTYLVPRTAIPAPTPPTTTARTSSSRGTRAARAGYITRVNLDADAAHRVTLLATRTDRRRLPVRRLDVGPVGAPAAVHGGERWHGGGVWQATPDFPSHVEKSPASSARAGYEGIQNDSAGNLWIVEDVGGTTGTTNNYAKQPNSFVYRFVPKRPRAT